MKPPGCDGGGPRTRRNLVRNLALGLAGAPLLASPAVLRAPALAQGAGREVGREARKVRVTLSTPGSAGSIWRSVVAGLDPALTRGVEIAWVPGDPGQMQVQLAAGAIDVGVYGAIGLATIARRGSDIVLFGPALNNHGRIIVRSDSPIATPADLKGRRIATQPKTTETYQQARVALSLIGVDMERDLEVIFGPPTANLALFERGDVDAVIVVEPTATRAVGNGARELARIADLWKSHDGKAGQAGGEGSGSVPFLVGLAAKRGWIEGDREGATAIARIFAAANAAITRRPAILAEHRAEMGLRPAETAATALLPMRLADVYPTRWDEPVWRAIDRQVEIAVALGLLETPPGRPLYDGVPLRLT